MSNEIVQANYDALEQIAVQFGDQADVQQVLQARVANGVADLRGGGWEGEGASAFFSEMDSIIQPASLRLIQALTEAQTATRLISETIRMAEEEAANHMKLKAGSAIPLAAAAVGMGAAAAAAVAAGGGATFAAGTVAGGNGGRTSPIGGDGLFTTEYMDNMIGGTVQGAGDARLIGAMRTLSGSPTSAEVSTALDQLAAARGVPRDQIQADYDRYVQLRAEADRIGAANGSAPWTSLNESRHDGIPWHAEFMGSTPQLRYGQVVGDVLGIDPVFGSLLNPTGGLVGPDNSARQFGDEHPVGYHGIVHDAAGYLYNYHDTGPGYNYMGLENHRDTGNPFTGQETGIAYWNERMGEDGWGATATNAAGTIMGESQDAWKWTKETAGDIKDGIGDFVDWLF